jgi:hypothetical protein
VRWVFTQFNTDTRFVDAMPVAYMKPLSGSGSKAMMISTMQTYGPIVLPAFGSVFNGSADTTFYIVALYFGSVGIKKSRYAIPAGLIADLAGVIAAIFISYLFFGYLNTTTACASSTNKFNLYLSDANGNFGAQAPIGSYTGFYGTFVNGVIPLTTTAGTNYRVRIQCTDPAILPVTSGPFEVKAVAGVTAGVSSQAISANTPEVFGACIGTDNTAYPFVNASSAGATATASFFNELSQTSEAVLPLPNQPFKAKAANYTVFVKAVDATGTVGTKAYSLINNLVNNSFGASGSNQVCLNGQNKLSYSVDINSPNGIQKNYPGLIYSVTWGDGLSTNFTLCDIVAAGGFIDHTYKKASCGNVANGLQNVFQIDLQPTSPICGKLGTPVTGYARVIEAAKKYYKKRQNSVY